MMYLLNSFYYKRGQLFWGKTAYIYIASSRLRLSGPWLYGILCLFSVPNIKTEASLTGFDSPEQFCQSKLKFMNTLADKTKEEKFTIDINVSYLRLYYHDNIQGVVYKTTYIKHKLI